MRVRESSGRGRFVLLAIAIAVLGVLTVGLVVLMLDSAQLSWPRIVDVLWRNRPMTATDRFAVLTVEIAGATYLLAVLAAVIAILAYGAATRMPDVEPQLQFPGCMINEPVVRRPNPADNLLEQRAGAPFYVKVGLQSRNRWTAEHVLMRVHLVDLTLPPNWATTYWSRDIITPPGAPVDTFELQQPVPRVYGQILQRYWPIDFTGLRLMGQHPAIQIYVAAHGGYLRFMTLPVTIES